MVKGVPESFGEAAVPWKPRMGGARWTGGAVCGEERLVNPALRA